MIPDECAGVGFGLEQVARYRLAARFAGGKRVLDGATGLGCGAAILAQAGAVEVTGIDADPQAIHDAAKRYALPNVRFRADDVTRLDTVPDGSVDLFVSFETIARLERGEDLVRQAARVLAPAGLLILSTPNGEASRCQDPSSTRWYRPGELAGLLRTQFPHVEIVHVEMDDPRDDPAGPPSLIAFASLAAPVETFLFMGPSPASENEERDRRVRNLEAGVAEREARIRDLQIALDRGEMRFALAIVRGMKRADRLLGRVPSRLARRLMRARRVMVGAEPPSPRATGGPFFSVVLPVYENLEFLRPAIDSVLGQTFRDFECVIYDDASPDPRLRQLLEEYRGHERVRLHFGNENLGISRATNRALGLAAGRYVAFLDSDDLLERNALERVARFLSESPEAEFVYTNRVDIDREGRVVEEWDFTDSSLGRPDQELLKGMFASHLKVIRREAFLKVGLFRSEFDSVQDYDMALRLSERCRVRFLDEMLYRHRVHDNQTTQKGLARQQVLADRARERAFLRRRIAASGYEGLVSIVVLSLNRPEETENCVAAIARHTPFRHEIVLVDNASEPAAVARLRALVRGSESVTLHELPKNLGVAGGRNFGASRARGDYLVFLDNDIEVGEGWLAALLTEMEAEKRLAACCCRVIFPNGIVQFTGGGMRAGSLRVRFDLLHAGRREDDLATLEQVVCDWVPGGATIFRKAVFDAMPFDTSLEGHYEDNDWSITARRAGHALGNAPLATVIHRQLDFSQAERRDKYYAAERYDKGKLERTLIRFYQKHGLFIDDEEFYRYLGYPGSEAFIEKILTRGEERPRPS